jgi:hypothetical protein
MFYKAIMLFVLIQPWVQPTNMSSAPDATVSAQQETAIQASAVPIPGPACPEKRCARNSTHFDRSVGGLEGSAAAGCRGRSLSTENLQPAA